MIVPDLPSGVYNVWVRNEDDSFPTDLGPFTIFETEPDAKVSGTSVTCNEGGAINLLLNDLPYAGEVQISIDSGANYDFTSTRGTWKYSISDLSSGDYYVWIRYDDGSCPTELAKISIVSNLIPIQINPMLNGDQSGPATDTLYTCPGSSLFLFCSPTESEYVWSITGPNNFTANARSFLVSNTLSTDMFGTYEIRYSRPDACEVSSPFVLLMAEDCETNIRSSQFHQLVDIYPNPANKFVTVVNNSDSPLFLELTDISGRVVHNQINLKSRINNIDLLHLSEGVYYVILTDNLGNRVSKSLIKKENN
jgi:hypothetical protein